MQNNYEVYVERCIGCGKWLYLTNICNKCSIIVRPKTNEGSVRNDNNQQRKGNTMNPIIEMRKSGSR